MSHRASGSARRIFAVLFSAGLLGGCTGAIGEVNTPGGAKDGLPAPRPDGPGRTRAGDPPSPDTGLWRLTRTEYNNTLHDLLGDTTRAGNALGDDATTNGFDNRAETLATSGVDVQAYDDIAAAVLESAFADSARRSKLLAAGCAGGALTEDCARRTVAAFARRAWRRPLEDDEVNGPDGLLTAALPLARAGGDSLEEGVKLAFRMVLTDPSFLYRVETDPPGSKGLHPVSSHELATRLSYFIWASTPDDELLAAADASGTANLSNPGVFAAQLLRMLRDPRVDSLVSNFAAQWLATRNIDSAVPDPKVFRPFYENNGQADLRRGMAEEPTSFFRELLKQDLDVRDLLDTNFTFVNGRLAAFYGLPAVTGAGMQKVMLPANSHRFGLLSQAGILMLTSTATRTNIPRRGKWVASRLLCNPPPPPPAMVPPLEDTKKSLGASVTWRQILEAHKKPECAGCHATFDPIGFALESYDGIGRWRTVDSPSGAPIDSDATLPDGTALKGPQGLARYIKDSPEFTRCFAKTMFGYAFGREPSAAGDVDTVAQLASDLAQRGGQIRKLVSSIASSQAFQYRGGPQP